MVEKTPKELVTPRQSEMMDLLATGISNREIAAKMFVSEWTVKTWVGQVSSLVDEHHRTTRTALAIWWLKQPTWEIIKDTTERAVNSAYGTDERHGMLARAVADEIVYGEPIPWKLAEHFGR